MANSREEKPNNLGDNKKRTPYKITYGIFQQIEKYNEKLGTKVDVLNLPPENSKDYKDLLKGLELHNEMILNAGTYTKVLGKDGVIKARIDNATGKELKGNKNRTARSNAMEASIGE